MYYYRQWLTIAGILCALSASAPATLIVYGANTDHSIVPGGSLTDVRMQVDMSVLNGQALVTFTNVSTGLEDSAVFKEIVIDMIDDDTGLAVLWDPQVLTNTKKVAYDIVTFNGLPGYTQIIGSDTGMGSLMARPSPVKKGIEPGEVLEVIFGTSLPDYAGTTEYLAFFNNGQDTGAYTLGFHAINAATVDAESLSAMNPPLETPDTPVPEPASVVFLVLGGAGALFRRRRRHR